MRSLRCLYVLFLGFALVAGVSIPASWQKVPTAHAATSTTPLILSASETVIPGETMDIQGGGFDLRATPWLQLVKSDGTLDSNQERHLVVANQSPYLIQAIVPSDMPAGLWAVWVANPTGGASNPKYVHQARGNGYDNQEVAAGDTLRIRGRNMVAPGGDFHTAYATFSSNGIVLTAPATMGDAYSMSVTIPSGVAVGTNYTIKVSNGLGGSTGENIVPYPLAIRTGGSDPFALGVPWGRDFAPFAGNVYDVTSDARLTTHALGNGTADDLPAIQAASLKASQSGGGVLYFPAGTYLLDNTSASLYLYPKVVLEGAGQSQTTLEYDKNPTAGQYFAFIDDSGEIGLKDLTVQDLNTGTVSTGALVTQYAAESTKVFFKDITYHLGTNAASVVGCYCNKGLMSGSTITNQSDANNSAQGAVAFGGSDIEFRNNSVSFGVGRNVFNGDNIVIENNSMHRNGNLDYPQQHEDGDIELSYSRNVAILNNGLGVVGSYAGDTNAHGSNEQILTQSSVFNLGILGTATSATATTLTDSAKDWSDPNSFYPDHAFNVDFFRHPVVAITSGSGLGQWRYASPNGTHSLSIDRPWDILPDQTSGYVINRWTADRFLISGNTITTGMFAIALGSGANDSTIAGNSALNAGPIAIWGSQDVDSVPPNTQNYLSWNNLIINNLVKDTTGIGNPVQVYIGGFIYNPNMLGNTTLDNEVRGNTVAPANPPTNSANGPDSDSGYYNYIFYGGGSYVGPDSQAVLGSIFENNSAFNVSAQPYVSMGATQSTSHYAGEPAKAPCLNLKLNDRPPVNQAVAGVTVKYFASGTEKLVTPTESWPSAADGTVSLNDPFLTGKQSGQAGAYPMVFRDSGTYDVWVKAPGFLARKVPAVTNVQTACVTMPTGLLAGDFSLNGKNSVDITDVVTWIRAFNGGNDPAAGLATDAYGAPLTINSLGTLIRTYRTVPNGDAP